MSTSTPPQETKPKLLERIIEVGKKAFDPANDSTTQESGKQEYEILINKTETWTLLSALNTLIRPNMLPEWLRTRLMETLTFLPLRDDGVRGTLEFVFSVHPSSAGRATDTTGPQKQGAGITHEALAVATKLLSSVPSSMTPLTWFEGISPQLLRLMGGSDGTDIAKAAAQVVGFGILGKRIYGAPGAPGWQVFVQPLIQTVNPSLSATPLSEQFAGKEQVIDLSQGQVHIAPEDLEHALQLLSALVLSNPSPGLCSRVLKPVLPQLWALTSPTLTSPKQNTVSKAAKELLSAYLKLSGSVETAFVLIRNLTCRGSGLESTPEWHYREANGGFEIVSAKFGAVASQGEIDWTELQARAEKLAEILIATCSPDDISSIFIDLFQRWIQTAGQSDRIKIEPLEDESKESAIENLAQTAVLQQLLERSPSKLIGHFDKLLDLISQVLKADSDAQLPDDLVAVTLSLLNLIFTAPTFDRSDINADQMSIVEQSLKNLSAAQSRPSISPTASNLSLLLKYRGELGQNEEPVFHPSKNQVEDRRTYDLAIGYITAADSPPPVISEGLNLLSGLISSGSSVLDVTAIHVLLSNLLQHSEDYVNLRVIKMFTLLANKHPKSTIREILDHFLDPQEKANTDTRLKFGEALVQVIERLGDLFSGEVAQQASETLLSIAGRRGYRPKTLAKQTREERKQKIKKETDDADDVNMDEDDRDEDEKAKDDVLAQILQGWESKRGAEDVRMRASALSILGTAMETNIRGIGPSLVSTSVDLCLSILTLEPEMEKGILRRSAIVVVLGFVRALESARESGRPLGFGLQDQSREDISRTLQYIADTDNDGLVQQHAGDVMESLENWQMSNLLPAVEDSKVGKLGSLAGLTVNPGIGNLEGTGKSRPRIEEINE